MVSFDNVLPTLLSECEAWGDIASCEKCCVVRDLEGRVRLALEPKKGLDFDPLPLEALLRRSLSAWFSAPILTTRQERDKGKLAATLLAKANPWNDAAWTDAAGNTHRPVQNRWFRLERRLSKFDWLLESPGGSAWELGAEGAPAIVTFYSFKGGVGRTTLLTACAWQLAATSPHKKVAVIDLDLEAPGLGPLLAAEADRGVTDFVVDFLATGAAEVDVLPAQALGPEDAGWVDVVPAGRLDLNYLEKLSRLDFAGSGGLLQEGPRPIAEALRNLLNRFRGKGYDFILLDARAGLHDIAGLSLHGFAHVDVLVGRASEQGYRGLDLTVEALARRRSPEELMTILVHSMVPADEKDAEAEKARFRERAYDIFKRHVYDPSYDDADIPQLDDASGPHAPYSISRHPKLETLDSVGPMRDLFFSAEYAKVVDRIKELCTITAAAAEETE